MKTLYIFDIDDTLIDTKACVRLVDEDGIIVARFGTKVYNGAVNTEALLQPGCRLDYSEFESLEQMKSEPTKPAMDILQSLKNMEDVYIITARRNRRMLYTYFHYLGIDIPEDHIRTNNEGVKNVASWKASILRSLIDQYDKAEIYEDDLNNIDHMAAICLYLDKPYTIHAV